MRCVFRLLSLTILAALLASACGKSTINVGESAIDRDPACDTLGLTSNGGTSLGEDEEPVASANPGQPIDRVVVKCDTKTQFVPVELPVDGDLYPGSGPDGSSGNWIPADQLDAMSSVTWLTDTPTTGQSDWYIIPAHAFQCVINNKAGETCTGGVSSSYELSTYQGSGYQIGGKAKAPIGPTTITFTYDKTHTAKEGHATSMVTQAGITWTQEKPIWWDAVLVRDLTIHHEGLVRACYGLETDCLVGKLAVDEEVQFWITSQTATWKGLLEQWQPIVHAFGDDVSAFAEQKEPNISVFRKDQKGVGGSDLPKKLAVTWSQEHTTLKENEMSQGIELEWGYVSANGSSKQSSGQETKVGSSAEMTYESTAGEPSRCLRLYKVLELPDIHLAGFAMKEGCQP